MAVVAVFRVHSTMSTSVRVASATDMPYHGGVVSLMQFCKNLLLLRCFFRILPLRKAYIARDRFRGHSDLRGSPIYRS